MRRMFLLQFSNDIIAKELDDIFSLFNPSIKMRGGPTTVPCLIFYNPDDERQCYLRRHELRGKGEVSCSDCIHVDNVNLPCRSEQPPADALAR